MVGVCGVGLGRCVWGRAGGGLRGFPPYWGSPHKKDGVVLGGASAPPKNGVTQINKIIETTSIWSYLKNW